MTDYVS